MPTFSDYLQPHQTAGAAVEEAEAALQVRVVHAAVKGRARFQVNGLYRCEPVRFRIESGLIRDAGISQVSANVLTGRVLIVFDPTRTIEEIMILVETLAGPPDSASAQRFVVDLHPLQPSKPVASAGANPASAQGGTPWHGLPGKTVLASLETSKECCLSEASVQLKLRRFGANTLPQTPPRSGLSIFLGHFKSLPVLLLGASAVLSAATGGLAEAIVILGVVLINAGTGYVTEAKAERTINALGEVTHRDATVIRDGQFGEANIEALVPGDILVLSPGDRVAADARLLESRNLMVDESSLTGESLPVIKRVEPLDRGDVALADRSNMVYKGSAVTGEADSQWWWRLAAILKSARSSCSWVKPGRQKPRCNGSSAPWVTKWCCSPLVSAGRCF